MAAAIAQYRRYQERETAQAVAMDLIDKLSTYIYVYVDNYQNKIYLKKIMKLFCRELNVCQFTARMNLQLGE